MRIVFAATAAHGHIIPLLPLARAFQSRGDEVAILTAAGAAPIVADESFTLLPAGVTPDVLIAELTRRFGINPLEEMTPEIEAEEFAGILVDFAADEAVKVASAWKPDLIVHEYWDCVGPLLASELDVPLATLAFGPSHQPSYAARREGILAHRMMERGTQLVPPRWYLDMCPPGLQIDNWEPPQGRLGLRPEAHRLTDQPMSHQVVEERSRPRVLVTFGTIFSSPDALNPLLQRLAKMDIDIVATTGVLAGPDDYSVDRNKVELVGFTPLSHLLQNVDLVVTHGGAGSTLAALSAGIPMVVIPQGADQPVQADRVTAAGAGISLPKALADPDTIAEAVSTVLARQSYRDAAHIIAAQICTIPSPQEVAAELVSALGH